MTHNPPVSNRAPPASNRAIGLWLLACCAMVFAIVIIGGVTRLTHSGLSMVEWRPLIGVLPPLTEVEWQRVFGLYQLSPESRLVNHGMSLDEFKGIFWWEWFHRLFAHLIGVVFFVPFMIFWLRGKVSRSLMPRLLGLFVLGGLQGVVGWLMVASGLVDRPAVSHYRLAAHLSTAVLIFTLMLWQALDLLRPLSCSGNAPGSRALRRHLVLALALALVTLVWGALVAGLHAGLIYNSFPLMNGSLLPIEAWFYEPVWVNVFENAALVQFCHRW
ncbi:MAG: COX15/CtaA family protein, partial [Rhodospirillaceae bacterium]